MTERPVSEVTLLRQLFLDRYDNLKARLTQRLGSADLAGDVLQDTWLRLSRTEAIGTVRNPLNYLFRMVLNVAQDRRRADKRHLSVVEVESLLHLDDGKPNPADVAEARSDLQVLAAALAELPPRRRAILIAARLDNLPRQEIAARLGISLRLVSKELRLAHEYCVARARASSRQAED
jgi:RNA polymerase sigma factor (sigma-70 family)